MFLAGAPIRSRIRDLVPNETKVPKWSQKVPILPPSPNFLILPSDAAEKRRHIAVSHCCALFRHTQCIMCMYFMLSGPLLPTDHQKYFEMENVATTHCFALFARFLHFHENNDLKVPERSKNGPKKVPILSQRPKFCLCSDFSRQVPNPKSYIGAPAFAIPPPPPPAADVICEQPLISKLILLS